MIDLHCHILPQVDDGATSEAEALEMLRIAADDGISHIVATPHVPGPTGAARSPEEIRARIDALNRSAQRATIPVTVLPGHEILLEPNVHERLVHLEVLTINDTLYVLVELPLIGEWPSYVRSAIFELQLAGYIPILAHVERYPAVQQDITILLDLVETGVILQVNAGSIHREADDRVSRTCRALLNARMVHVIASDGHSSRSRAPRMRSAINLAGELVDRDYADWIVAMSERVIHGESVTVPEPIVARKARRPRFWRDRM